ncbi:MAG: hypothetical protein HY243_12165 [Proteobacteria bacterium]|nr:hypothetical protein [Pseudomonadota bacterium]
MVNPVSDTDAVIAIVVFAAASIWAWWPKGPRFIVDERGERQRVDHWNRGEPVYNPKTWQQRVFEEATFKKQRRRKLLEAVITVAIILGIAVWAGPLLGGMIVLAAMFVVPIPLAFFVIPPLWTEIRYQLGDQGIEGAKVLDKKPGPQPGREVVETQKAHGDAQLASEAEALTLLNSKN